MTETEIQKQILSYLQKAGWKAWKNHIGPVRVKGGRTPNLKKGSADIEAIKNGVFMNLEVKTDSGKISTEQIEWLNDIVSKGGISIVAHSLDSAILGVVQQTDKGSRIHEIWFSKAYLLRSG